MLKISLAFIFCLFALSLSAQHTIRLSGRIINSEDVEGIHIFNRKSENYTVTDEQGKFIIEVKLNDTLVFTSVRYYTKLVAITQEVINEETLLVELEEFVNVLDEVIVGKILTGNLNKDIDISTTKRDINFYDVGIPGNTNLPITQNQRRLFEADAGKFVYFYGLGFAINVNKILNRVSGRTRELKEFVALDKRDECMEKSRLTFQYILFPEDNYSEEIRYAFFFFASEDVNFREVCLVNNDMAMFEFLEKKKEQFLKNLNSNED